MMHQRLMNRCRFTATRLMLAALVQLSTAAPAFAQTAAEPSPYEVEVWRAAAKLDTPEAYEAYLKRFPNGAFSELAHMTLAKSPAAVKQQAPKAVVEPKRTLDLAQLARADAENETGALSVGVGNKLIGPGVITVGWLGAKRQVIVPNGDWIVLAAFDHPLQANGITLRMTTLVLGSFSATDLRSLLLVTLNSRSIPPANAVGVAMPPTLYAGMLPRWPASEACEPENSDDLFHQLDPSNKLRTCALVRRLAGRGDALSFAPGTAERVDAMLARLGLRRPTLALRTDLHFTEASRAYMGYVRFDAAPDGTVDEAWTLQRVSWLRGFAPIAAKAYFRGIDLEDLVPGKAATAGTFAELPS